MAWRRQDLVSGSTTIEAPKAPSGVRYGGRCPLPSRLGGLGERRELPQRDPAAAEPRPLSHFLHVFGHRTLLVATPKYKEEFVFFIWKKNCKFHFEKVVVTSHHRHMYTKLRLWHNASLDHTCKPDKWHVNPSNVIGRVHEYDRRQKDHAREKCVGIGGIACAARAIPPNLAYCISSKFKPHCL